MLAGRGLVQRTPLPVAPVERKPGRVPATVTDVGIDDAATVRLELRKGQAESCDQDHGLLERPGEPGQPRPQPNEVPAMEDVRHPILQRTISALVDHSLEVSSFLLYQNYVESLTFDVIDDPLPTVLVQPKLAGRSRLGSDTDVGFRQRGPRVPHV